MEKFLRKTRETEFFSKRLSGYISPEGKVFLSDTKKLFLKRAFDIVISILFLVFIMSWLFPLLALMIKANSPGPVIFKQRRHGKGNKVFNCYKFRTMRMNGEADVKQATRNDRRVTKLGKFLRRTSLDEIPQFINVLLGDMSVIGPRPHAVPMNQLFAKEVDNYKFRHSVKPGITGLAQTRGYRGEIKDFYDIYGRVKLDHFYIRKWCLWLDIQIIFWTIKVVLIKNRNTY